MDAVRNPEAPCRQGADPGCHRVEIEFHRASRADRAAYFPLRQAGRARERHRRLGLWLRHLGGTSRGRSRRRLRQARGDGRRRAAGDEAVLDIAAMDRFGLVLRSVVLFLFPIPFLLDFAVSHGGDWTGWLAYIAVAVFALGATVGGLIGSRP